MDREKLAAWVEAEAAKGTSYRQLAFSLGVTPTALAGWRSKSVASLSEDSLIAIAARRKESVEDTASWLGVDAPDAYDWPTKFRETEKRLRKLEQLTASLLARLNEREKLDPNLTLNSYLLERGIDVSATSAQEEIAAIAAQVSPATPGFERFLLICVGLIEPVSDDLSVVSAILKRLTDEPWTPQEVHRVTSAARNSGD